MAGKQPASFTQRKANQVSLEEKMKAWAKRKASSGIDWKDVSAASLRAALHAALAEGVAVMFAQANGGSSVLIRLYVNGDKISEYASTAEEVELLLEGVADAFSSTAEDLREAMKPGKE